MERWFFSKIRLNTKVIISNGLMWCSFCMYESGFFAHILTRCVLKYLLFFLIWKLKTSKLKYHSSLTLSVYLHIERKISEKKFPYNFSVLLISANGNFVRFGSVSDHNPLSAAVHLAIFTDVEMFAITRLVPFINQALQDYSAGWRRDRFQGDSVLVDDYDLPYR